MDVETIVKPVLLEGLSRIANWYKSDSKTFLRSIFDLTGFKDRHAGEPVYFSPPLSLSSTIPYPVHNNLQTFADDKKKTLMYIDTHYDGFSENYLGSLNSGQLLFLLEKFGGNVPFDENGCDAVYDVYKIRAARHLIQWNEEHLDHKGILLINVDLSGIQPFIYNVVSAGALKNLRSRSFFIELLSNHVIKRILDAFHLDATNVLMEGGGSIYVLSGCPQNYRELLHADISYRLNKWLLGSFNGRLYAVFSDIQCSDSDLDTDISHLLKKLAKQAFINKRTKFRTLIEMGQFPFIEDKEPMYQSCEICHRDDAGAGIKQVGKEEGRFRCYACDQLIQVGNKIPAAKYVYCCDSYAPECLQIEEAYYFLSDQFRQDLPCLWLTYQEDPGFLSRIGKESKPIISTVYTTKVSDLRETVLDKLKDRKRLILAQLALTSDEEDRRYIEDELDSLQDESIATIEHLAECSDGAKLVAALRMDSDNMGRLIHDGFYNKASLHKLSAFSRNINYFFKLHLTALCQNSRLREGGFSRSNGKRRNVQVIYAGGDDLFLIGAWSDAAELSVEIGKSFRDYTCGNLDLGLSGGLTLHHAMFPVNKMAEESKSALSVAKDNVSACWMCREDWVGCPLYDTGACLRKDSLSLFFTGYMASLKKKVQEEQRVPKYQEETLRLKLAVKWKRYDMQTRAVVDEVEEYVTKPLTAFIAGQQKLGMVFYHNVLSLLSIWYEQGVLYMPKIAWMIQKFSNELRRTNLQTDNQKTLLDMYETYLHFYDKDRFSTLHIPLSWSILLKKGVDADASQINGRKTI